MPTLLKNHKALQDLLQQKGRLSNDLENMVKSTHKTIQGPRTTPRVNDRGGQNGKMPGRDKQKDVSFKKPSDDLIKNTSKQRRGMLDFTPTYTKPKDTSGDKNEFIKDCDIGMQDAEPEESARILAMTQDELDQAHDIFMITVHETDMANIPAMTDTKMYESANENADNTSSMTWEETDSEGVQLQSASRMGYGELRSTGGRKAC